MKIDKDIKLKAYNILIKQSKELLEENNENLETILMSNAVFEIQEEIKKTTQYNLGMERLEQQEDIEVAKAKIQQSKLRLEELEESKKRYIKSLQY